MKPPSLRQTLIAASLAAVIVACDTTEPLRPNALELVSGAGQSAVVNTTVPSAPAVRVVDQNGRAFVGVTVQFAVVSGGGSIAVASVVSGSDGVASAGSWTLGTTAGAQAATATVEGVSPVTFTATALPGAPHAMSVHAGGGQQARVTQSVAVPPSVRVTDRFGNGVSGLPVRFDVTRGGGTVDRADQQTGSNGVAAVQRWTLGTQAGEQLITVSAGGLSTLIVAQAAAADPATFAPAQGDAQTVTAGELVPVVPSVAVRDVHDNPVSGLPVVFTVTAGGGTITGDNATTDLSGIAVVGSWRTGAQVGANVLTATIAGVAQVQFTVQGIASTFNLSVDAVHINQGNQNLDGTIRAVAERAGLLRVIVRANEPNAHAPSVSVRLFAGAELIREATVTRQIAGVPIQPDLNDATQTWNLALAAHEMRTNLRIEVVVDPASTITDVDPSDNRFPRVAGTTHAVEPVPLAPMRVVFIPIVALTNTGQTPGNIHPGNVEDHLRATRRWIPASSIVTEIRPPFTTSRDLRTASEWSGLLQEIQAMRTAEGATDQYYHGLVRAFSGMAVGGIAFRPSTPQSAARSALSSDAANETVAHEFGHNLGRPHAPCGGPAGPDPLYPYANAIIGRLGYDILTGGFVAPTSADYMSYCGPRWTSDYQFAAILDWRRQDPFASGSAVTLASASVPGLAVRQTTEGTEGVLVMGTISRNGVTLSPAFTLATRPVLPTEPGPHQLRGVGADGSELFRFSFEGTEVAHADDPSERHFVFFVPLAAARAATLDRIEVTGPRGSATRSVRAVPPGVADVAVARTESPAAGRIRVRWDADQYPMVMVRDAQTGTVVAFGRGGDVELLVGSIPAARLEVLLSDGVRSRVARRSQ